MKNVWFHIVTPICQNLRSDFYIHSLLTIGVQDLWVVYSNVFFLLLFDSN